MEYFYIWIEGLGPRTGEKVCCLTSKSYDVTDRLTLSTRAKEGDVEKCKELLMSLGVGAWTLESAFLRTSYAPKGTLWKPE